MLLLGTQGVGSTLVVPVVTLALEDIMDQGSW